MARTPPLANFDSPVALNNLDRSYRMMARLMTTSKSRDQLLRMAVILEEKSRIPGRDRVAGQFEILATSLHIF
jgi:hypothetical protein